MHSKLQPRQETHKWRYSKAIQLEPLGNDRLGSNYPRMLTTTYPALLLHSHSEQQHLTYLIAEYGRSLDTLEFFTTNKIVGIRQAFHNQPVTIELDPDTRPHVDSMSKLWPHIQISREELDRLLDYGNNGLGFEATTRTDRDLYWTKQVLLELSTRRRLVIEQILGGSIEPLDLISQIH